MKKMLAKFLVSFVCSISVFSSSELVNGERPWNFSDDSKLLKGFSITGGHWLLISKKMFGGKRAPSECKERYNEHLRPALEINWSNENINSLHRRVLSVGPRWEDFEKNFFMPAVVIKKKYDETIEEFTEIMKTMDKDCSWLPKQLWVNDVDISD